MSEATSNYYHTKSAVLFILFNRVDTSLRVLDEIKKARPERLYITADGPRPTREGEARKCAETKSAVLNAIDWNCEVKTLFREHNFGPKEAISAAVSWFFEHETEGIILEHDCLPSNSFFKFCDNLLEKYRFDTRIWLISGSNLLKGKRWNNASYYFSQLTNGWGWATWQRSWKDYDKDLKQYEEGEVKAQLEKIFDHPIIVNKWVEIFKDTKSGKIDTWDYQATFVHFFNHCLNIVPNYNLISNIGFGKEAENTTDENSIFAAIPLEEMDEIIHPKFILPEKEADFGILWEEFRIDDHLKQLKKHNSARRRLKRWLRALFK